MRAFTKSMGKKSSVFCLFCIYFVCRWFDFLLDFVWYFSVIDHNIWALNLLHVLFGNKAICFEYWSVKSFWLNKWLFLKKIFQKELEKNHKTVK